ncbi:MAG TPA: hypothetical protein TECP_01339 [Hyphomicrobiaceae bacterium MAG_BT-2024]
MMRSILHILQIASTTKSALAIAVVMIIYTTGAVALDPGEILDNPELELRARNLSAELRCLVCQNQSIVDSNAPLARDLRLLVRERITMGDSDVEVIKYIVDRYGEFILLRPPLGWHTLFLWLSPLLFLAFGLSLAYFASKQQKGLQITADGQNLEPLTDTEQQRLKRMLNFD